MGLMKSGLEARSSYVKFRDKFNVSSEVLLTIDGC
jgi:hypothetical protein